MSLAGPHAALLHPTHALALLRSAGLLLTGLQLTYRRVLESSGVAAYQLSGQDAAGEPVETLGYARWDTPGRVAEMARKWDAARAEPNPLGAGVHALPEANALLFLLPNDRGLKLLPKLTEPDKLKRVLAPLPELEPAGWRIKARKSALDIRRYKPEQRMVARARLALVHDAEARTRELEVMVRLFGDERGARIARDVAAWRDAGAAALLPRPLGSLESGAVYVEEALTGHTLRSCIRDAEVTPAAMAHALAALHGAPAEFERRQGVRERLAMIDPVLGALEGAGIAGSAEAARELTAAAPAEHAGVPIHGDLHARQVLVEQGQPRFVDFERCAQGDPLDDLGNLLAHLEWEHATMGAEGAAAGPFARALAREYAAITPKRAPDALGFYRACALLEIAELPVRRRAEDAPAVSARAVAMARAALRGQG